LPREKFHLRLLLRLLSLIAQTYGLLEKTG
jgi:hypothetical protein